jgi:hypothetical protein
MELDMSEIVVPTEIYTRERVYGIVDGVKAGWATFEDGIAEILENKLWTVLDYADFAAMYAGEGLDKFKLSAAVRTSAIKQLAADRPKDSNREIAKRVGVTHTTVNKALKSGNKVPLNNKIIDVSLTQGNPNIGISTESLSGADRASVGESASVTVVSPPTRTTRERCQTAYDRILELGFYVDRDGIVQEEKPVERYLNGCTGACPRCCTEAETEESFSW